MKKLVTAWTVMMLSVSARVHAAHVVLTPEALPTTLTRSTQVINTAGLLDQTFGTVGSTVNQPGAPSEANAVCLQPDGKLIIAGSAGFAGGANNDIVVQRYTTTGAFDTSFGTAGSTITGLGDGTNTVARAVCLQPNGSIVVAGYAHVAALELALAQYTAAGVLDTTFGTQGSTLTSLGNNTATVANGACLQPDGKIIVVGSVAVAGGTELVIARYTTAGILDPTFGTNGYTLTSLGNLTNTVANAVCLQPDGNIVVAGYAVFVGGTELVIARYTTAGILDPTFGTNGGYTPTSLGNLTNTQANAVCLQSNGNIVVAGKATVAAGSDLFVARYTAEGGIDTTFGTQGSTLTSLGNNTATEAYGACLQPDGKIIVVGSVAVGGGTELVIARYTTAGILDPTFGTNGYTLTSLGNITFTQGFAVCVQPNGKLVVAGTGPVQGNSAVAILRYINPFTLSTFNASYGPVGLI